MSRTIGCLLTREGVTQVTQVAPRRGWLAAGVAAGASRRRSPWGASPRASPRAAARGQPCPALPPLPAAEWPASGLPVASLLVLLLFQARTAAVVAIVRGQSPSQGDWKIFYNIALFLTIKKKRLKMYILNFYT